MRIDGSNILVTGASSGIGAALAPILAERGATVGIVARRADRLTAVLDRCRAFTPGSRMWTADLGDLDRAEQVATEAWDAFGGLDVLVNNAAIPKRTRVTDLTPYDVHHVMDVDFHSPVRMSLALLPRMIERRHGQIVFVSSMGGRIPIMNEAAYNAAKYAMCGFAEAMLLDLAGTEVEVKLVLPGPIATEIWEQPDNVPALIDVDKVPANDCAAGIADAIEDDGFEYYVPAVFPGGIDAKEIAVGKTQHCDQYLRGMADFARSLREAERIMIEVRDNTQRFRYEAVEDGTVVGFVQYSRRGGRIILVHTEIQPSHSGRGIASTLVAGALDDIRRRGILVVPVCPFVEAYIARHPEYDDLVDHEMFDALNAERQ